MRILSMDTSNQGLGVAILEDRQVLANTFVNVKRTHSELLMPSIDSLLQQLGIDISSIDRFVVAKGPGSYTGIRIGVTTAKSLAFTLNKELVGISSLAAIAANAPKTDDWLIPIFNARRDNVFAGVYHWVNDQLVNVVPDQHLGIHELTHQLAVTTAKLTFIGDDVAVFKQQLLADLPGRVQITSGLLNYPNAANLGLLGFDEQPIADLDNFVPAYLRLTEAETNWLKNHHVTGHENYVEEV